MTDALQALRKVDFDWVRSLDSIWDDADTSDGGSNAGLIDRIVEELDRGGRSRWLIGQPGIGKTHLMAVLRRRVWQSGGWFVLLDVLGLTEFWRSTALSFLTSLLQGMPDGRRQLDAVVAGVARFLGAEPEIEAAFANPRVDVGELARVVTAGLMKKGANALPHLEALRALCLLRAGDADAAALSYAWLQGYDADEQARSALGFRSPPPMPIEIVRSLLWLMNLSGPTIVGLDQIDGVINSTGDARAGSDDFGAAPGLAEKLANGLMDLYDVQTRDRMRVRTVVACLDDSWKTLLARAIRSASARFDEPDYMVGMAESTQVEALIVGRLAPACKAAGFVPPFPSWPFSKTAIEGAASAGMTPRTILMRCDVHRRQCVRDEQVRICDDLIGRPPPLPPTPPADDFATDLARSRTAADISGLLLPDDDGPLSRLLVEAFDLYRRELDPDEGIDVESKADPARKVPPLHGRLTFTHHRENDRERHYCFRALEHAHAVAFQSRLRAALTASGISTGIPDRHLVIVRRAPVPGGAKTKQLFDGFIKAGGVLIDPADDDLRIFVALHDLHARSGDKKDGFEAWLRAAKPLAKTEFFRRAGLASPPSDPAPGKIEPAKPAPTSEPSASVESIPIGHRMTVDAEPVDLQTRLLPRHTSIIAGSGSGKTVLLRRLVEEAALAGIPAIVVDPNNDLSRLGDPWPARPDGFTPEDEGKAKRYFGAVEVVVWTPGVHAGNPLFLSVLPDFASVGDDRDEREQAIAMAAETLAPIAGAKKTLQQGVLSDALRHFARKGGDLSRFIALLADLPDGLSKIGTAAKLAAGMADQLRAAISTNPLLQAEGPILDPKLLFFGDKKRVRVSVINLSGLASDQAKEDFVNRLQMTLFGWIKKNPSSTGRLYVIDEAQTFLPAQSETLSLGSGRRLFQQARKYGLGMIVATQAPRGVHNQIVSNCTTQFFGKQSAPATISAAQEIMAASGARADDIGRLKAGEFYFATEGLKFAKVRTPLCLSFHPANPPTPEEVVARAARSRSRR